MKMKTQKIQMIQKTQTITMTNVQCLNQAVEILIQSGNDNALFDAECIFEKAFEINKTQYLLKKNDTADSEKTEVFFKMIERRVNNEPLQYILGQWEFYGLDFKVGEGVLIPRPDTEILIDFVLENKISDNPIIYDLCSGSGCIGITVAKNIPEAQVYLAEKSPLAYKYLEENIKLNNTHNVFPYLKPIPEVLSDFPDADIIISNPPYIKSEEIPALQKEVQYEPTMALDGGEDGLYFYRLLKDYAIPKLKKGGYIIVECGDTQARDIAEIFETYIILKDYSSIERAVVKRKE